MMMMRDIVFLLCDEDFWEAAVVVDQHDDAVVVVRVPLCPIRNVGQVCSELGLELWEPLHTCHIFWRKKKDKCNS